MAIGVVYVKASYFEFEAEDGVVIYAKNWISETESPKAIVQIAHGMAEHITRYDDFAEFLVNQGFAVYGNDHRGHGKMSEKQGNFGYFADESGFEKVVGDLLSLTKVIEKDFPEVPVFLFGHSLGSFLTRRYMQLYGDHIQGAILSGTGGHPGVLGKVAKAIAGAESRIRGRKTPSSLMTKLTFGAYNKNFNPVKTEFDWLSRDEKEVRKYSNDPLCGGECSTGLFIDLFEGLNLIHERRNLKGIPKELPLYIFSGDKDPVGNNTKGVRQVYEEFKTIGMMDVSLKFYKEGRHEMLNEVNKEEVYEDILSWLNKHLEE